MSGENEWIDPALDGSGGGYGRFKGMSVRELSQTFATIAEEGNMRSVTAILRISREQLEGRSQLAVSLYAAILLGVLTAVLALGLLFVSGEIRTTLLKGVGICGILFGGFVGGAISTRKQTKAAIAQDRAICGLAVDALEVVLRRPGFRPRPLDSLQRQTLRQMVKKAGGNHPEIQELLAAE